MKTLTQSQFNEVVASSSLKARLKKDLKFVKSTESLGDDWSELELLAISDKTGNKGALLLQPYESLYLVPYEIVRKITDSKTGRARAVICDFCYTWQSGANAASITFSVGATKRSVRFLCCADLLCSKHVRSLTKESRLSRAQLRESLSDEDRVARLKQRLDEKIKVLELDSVFK